MQDQRNQILRLWWLILSLLDAKKAYQLSVAVTTPQASVLQLGLHHSRARQPRRQSRDPQRAPHDGAHSISMLQAENRRRLARQRQMVNLGHTKKEAKGASKSDQLEQLHSIWRGRRHAAGNLPNRQQSGTQVLVAEDAAQDQFPRCVDFAHYP